MKLAYVLAPGRGDTDRLLFDLAETLALRGCRTCGTVQINTDRGSHPCDMDVRVLPDGPVLRISQNLGPQAKGCRLDAAMLETAVGLVEARLATACEVMIVNKFGKHEAEGRGLRTVIAEAISRDLPVLVGVNALNLKAFREFAGPGATRLEPSRKAILAWLDAMTGARPLPGGTGPRSGDRAPVPDPVSRDARRTTGPLLQRTHPARSP